MTEVDWNLVQVFLAVARTSSFTGAAAGLRSSQPTVGRQIRQLEEQLGVALVVRSPRGITLTEAGGLLAQSGAGVEDRMGDLLREVRREANVVRGTVRVGAAEPIAAYVLPSILAPLQQEHPALAIELSAGNAVADLLAREVDVAVRMFVPEQLDLVRRYVGAIPMGLYASRAYIARRGEPADVDALLTDAHVMIGFDRDAYGVRVQTTIDPRFTREAFAFRTDALLVQWEAARGGAGVVAMQVPVAGRDPELVRILAGVPLGTLPVWLAMHRDVRGSAAVRATFDALHAGLERYVSAANESAPKN